MFIETERLAMIPMDKEMLEIYRKNYKAFLEKYGYLSEKECIEDYFKKILKIKIDNIKSEPEMWLYNNYWLFYNKTNRMEIGMVGFKGKKDMKGRMEVGYGIDRKFFGKGYMTEALEGFCKWNLSNLDINGICASVNKDNIASIRVLEKNGFKMYEEDEKFFWYELLRS